jgi:hypothetical protein
MRKYKRITTPTLTDGTEVLSDMLSGFAGKNRKIVSIATAPLADMYLRVYRDAEQIVDVASIHLTTAAPWLPMDLPLAEGQQCKVGFYNDGAVTTAKQITVGYEEAG